MGFILTKWYVNKYDYYCKECGNGGFILTKWYVNHININKIVTI